MAQDWDTTPHEVPAELNPAYDHADPPDHSAAVIAGARIMDRLPDDVYQELSAWLNEQ